MTECSRICSVLIYIEVALHFFCLLPECCPTGDDYQYDAVVVGCVAPAPTPALITTAPLGNCFFCLLKLLAFWNLFSICFINDALSELYLRIESFLWMRIAECETYAPDDEVSITSGIDPQPTDIECTAATNDVASTQPEQSAPPATARVKKKKQKSVEKGT